MTQGDLFRDAAINQVEENADLGWFNEALLSVEVTAWVEKEFTTDEVWERMTKTDQTHDNRAMGAVMRKAQSKGWIEPTDRVVKSNRAVCHSRPIRVWRSRLI